MPTQSSNQSIAKAGINVGDGQGGIIQVSGLPAALGSVKVSVLNTRTQLWFRTSSVRAAV